MAAGVVADRDLLAGELLGLGDLGFWRHHDAARREDVDLPHILPIFSDAAWFTVQWQAQEMSDFTPLLPPPFS